MTPAGHRTLPLPPHWRPGHAGQLWRVDYEERAREAAQWARRHEIRAAAEDSHRVALLLIDVQNTFCIPGYELFVGGRTGSAAVEDTRRLCEMLYRHLDAITRVFVTLDTHQAFQIFHPICLVDETGLHPDPYTVISRDDVEEGRWRFNPRAAPSLGVEPEEGQRHLVRYVRSLAASGRYELTVWPYHALLGGIGHAMAASIEEAMFFHSVARMSQPRIRLKGFAPLTEAYSALGPEAPDLPRGRSCLEWDTGASDPGAPDPDGNADAWLREIGSYDAILVAGQAKSHCVSWTVDDMLRRAPDLTPGLSRKLYLLEDCTSPVVVPGALDTTETADATFRRFAEAGAHRVRSTDRAPPWRAPAA